MNHEQKIEYIKSQIDEFSDSRGELDLISLIEHTQAKFGITGKEAELLVYEAMGYDD